MAAWRNRTTKLRFHSQGIIRWAHPILASAILIYGGAALITADPLAPFAIAGSTTLFLLSGIDRTWGQTLALIELSNQP
jgi:hypothetical protein